MVFALLLFSQTQEQWGQAGHLVCRYVVLYGKHKILRSREARQPAARRATRREVARCREVTGCLCCAPLTPQQGGLGSRVWANHKSRRPVELLLRGSVHA
jgi:hypothetical protein